MIALLYAHLLGDYIIQSDWMALNKKKHWYPCLVHVLTYLIPFAIIGVGPVQLVLIGLQHYIQDRTNFVIWFMKIKGSEKFAEPPCAPWSIFLTDNILHLLWISLVMWMPL